MTLIFVQICGNLKDVAFKPSSEVISKRQRLVIPVEKSGGGV